jgi:4-aminobutyrate--pyruvate transaminase
MNKRAGFPLILGASNLPALDRERPLVFTRGRGIFLWDEHGREYLEAASSFYCAAFGFDEPELVQAAADQMRTLPFAISAAHRTTSITIALAERLAALAPFPNATVAFANSGSEANDALLKFARFANVARGRPDRRKIICRSGSYHGSTTLTASLGSSAALRRAFALPVEDVIHVSQPDISQLLPGEDEARFVDRLARELEEAIETAGAENIAGFLAEPVSFSAGLAIPPKDYFPRVCATLVKHGIPFFGDEVVTGFYRLGPMMGWQALSLRYQALTLGKALTAAFLPMGAILLDEELTEAMKVGNARGVFGHVSTYAGHPVCAAVANRVLDLLEQRCIGAHVAEMAPVLRASLEELRAHALVRGVRCIGLAAAIDLQVPPGEPTPDVAILASAVQAQAFAHGLIVRLNADVIIVAPPLIITRSEIAELTARLRRALDGAMELLKHPESIRLDPNVVHPNRA